VSWSVNGVAGGGREFGVITSDGLYTAPARIPAVNEVCIMATLRGAANRYAWATVLLGSKEPEYTLVNKWGEQGKGPGQFTDPHGITLDADGNLVVTDSSGCRVYRFTREGKLIGELTPGDGVFQGPRDAALDASGNIYVADGTWERIVKFTRDGKPIASWGQKGSQPGEFQRPHAITIGRNGHIYAADVDNYGIQVYDLSGKFLFQWGSRGTGAGQFSTPHGVAVDPNGDIFVCEYDGVICQKFTADGVHLMTFIVKFGTGLTTCHSMSCDHNGNVYFSARADGGQRALILKYNNQGDFITSLGAPPNLGRVFMPSSTVIDQQGRVYVADKGDVAKPGKGVDIFAPGRGLETRP
jgi:DNA-binding beta-propeller fold protein YncE